MKIEVKFDHFLPLLEYYRKVQNEVCAAQRPQVWPADVDNIRCKRVPIAKARWDIAARLRETVGQRQEGGTFHVCIFPDGRPNDWEPLSFPHLGDLTGLHYTTHVTGQKKRIERLLERSRLTVADSAVDKPCTTETPACRVGQDFYGPPRSASGRTAGGGGGGRMNAPPFPGGHYS